MNSHEGAGGELVVIRRGRVGERKHPPEVDAQFVSRLRACSVPPASRRVGRVCVGRRHATPPRVKDVGRDPLLQIGARGGPITIPQCLPGSKAWWHRRRCAEANNLAGSFVFIRPCVSRRVRARSPESAQRAQRKASKASPPLLPDTRVLFLQTPICSACFGYAHCRFRCESAIPPIPFPPHAHVLFRFRRRAATPNCPFPPIVPHPFPLMRLARFSRV